MRLPRPHGTANQLACLCMPCGSDPEAAPYVYCACSDANVTSGDVASVTYRATAPAGTRRRLQSGDTFPLEFEGLNVTSASQVRGTPCTCGPQCVAL